MLMELDFPGTEKFPIPGKNSRMGEFREIAYSPSLQNSVATVRKLTDAARRRVIKVPFRSQYRPMFANWCDLAVGRPISIQLCSLLWTPTSEDHLSDLTPPLHNVLWSSDPLAIRFCAHTLWIELQTLSTAGDVAIHCNDCCPRELHDCRSIQHSNMRSILLSDRLSMISDHASRMCRRQKWHVISVFPCAPVTATSGLEWTTHMHVGGPHKPCHAPRWSAAMHGSDDHRAIISTITAGENCRTQYSIESRTSPKKFISLLGNLFPGELTTLVIFLIF